MTTKQLIRKADRIIARIDRVIEANNQNGERIAVLKCELSEMEKNLKNLRITYSTMRGGEKS